MIEQFRSRHIILVGFMGTGKSTVSLLLAERAGCEAVDVDKEIERREGRSIPDLFASLGEEGFRKAETKALAAVVSSDDMKIIATGGGAVLASYNRELMIQNGFVAALTATPARIIERVGQDTNRPLLQGGMEDRVYKLLAERKHAYDFAHATIDTTDLDPASIAEKICSLWRVRE